MESEQSRELNRAAVASLRRNLGLSEAEARRRFAAQAGLDALSARLLKRLGERQAGAWIDPANGDLVVNVLNAEDAHTVEAAGAHARIVRHASRQLVRLESELNRTQLPRGSSLGIDPHADAVVIDVPHGQSFTPARDYKGAVVIKHSPAPARRMATPATSASTNAARADLYAGLTINRDAPGGVRCTSGFLITPKQSSGFHFNYLLTAGHCGGVGSKWFRGNSQIGSTSHSELGPNDFSTIALNDYATWQPQPWSYTQNGPQPVRGGYTVSTTGSTVCMRGSSTEYNCGQVLDLNASYFSSTNNDQISGVVKTSLCAIPGDSGAPVTVPNGSGVLG
ncbi:S1 family peptidase, partial [Streptomyces sp. NPDC006476]|uniref:S1 family peptidase n=1 Tax=Streptomyces sp. NPDC006476 TaxID=3157175 RepID=UPI0033A12810